MAVCFSLLTGLLVSTRFKTVMNMFALSLRVKIISRPGHNPYSGKLLRSRRLMVYGLFVFFHGILDGEIQVFLVKRLAHKKMHVFCVFAR